MNYILLTTSTAIFIALITTVWVKFGVQKSISASYYCFKPKYRWMFSAALIGFSWPIIIISPTPLIFMAGSFITFVAIAANFNDSETAFKTHIICAMIGIIEGVVSLVIDFHQYYLVGVAVVIGLLLLKFTKNYTWWIEILAFITIISGLAIEMI